MGTMEQEDGGQNKSSLDGCIYDADSTSELKTAGSWMVSGALTGVWVTCAVVTGVSEDPLARWSL